MCVCTGLFVFVFLSVLVGVSMYCGVCMLVVLLVCLPLCPVLCCVLCFFCFVPPCAFVSLSFDICVFVVVGCVFVVFGACVTRTLFVVCCVLLCCAVCGLFLYQVMFVLMLVVLVCVRECCVCVGLGVLRVCVACCTFFVVLWFVALACTSACVLL